MKQNELSELNAHIAEHVMGWVWWKLDTHKRKDISRPKAWCQLVRGEEKWPKEHWGAKRLKAPIKGMEQDVDVPKYTTDPAAAMEVLKRCKVKVTKENGSIDIDGDENHSSISAQMRGEYAADSEHETEAKTLELAICQFAKKLFSK